MLCAEAGEALPKGGWLGAGGGVASASTLHSQLSKCHRALSQLIYSAFVECLYTLPRPQRLSLSTRNTLYLSPLPIWATI